ncbi:hypothetical protein [uncultured Tolumonas sp.]|uniref:hypothetical protein n=1 Tax=uncultured Tolumonas sp. TaxID=263765 RepID=UPI002A0A1F9D|nr:hypothetical protein [uncultured Tolumonas sp.]
MVDEKWFGDDYLIINEAIFLSEIKSYRLRSCLCGCTYNAITYDLSHTRPKVLVPLFMVETECEALLKNELKALVGTEKDKIYHIESDVNDENFRKIKVFN